MKKKQTIKQILSNPPPTPEVPYWVWSKLGSRDVSLFGNQVSFGENDYGTVEEMQIAIEWYVKQFGGTVKW